MGDQPKPSAYREYKNVDLIPAELFRRTTIKDELKKRYAVFDIEALKKEIPAFLVAMEAQGIDGLDAARIEKLLSSYGFDDQRIGPLDLMFDKEGYLSVVDDIDGSVLHPDELAVIFINYLHSIGQPGEVVKSYAVSSVIDKAAERLGVKLVKIPAGVKALLDYPHAMLGLIAGGSHMPLITMANILPVRRRPKNFSFGNYVKE